MKKHLTFLIILLVYLILLSPDSQTQPSPIMQSQADVNSDNKVDHILLQKSDTKDWLLMVNDTKITITEYGNQEEINGFILVDIDKKDPFQEIAVHSVAMTDANFYNMFRYDGKTLTSLPNLTSPIFHGDGTISLRRSQGFWVLHEKFKWNESTKNFVYIPQKNYVVQDWDDDKVSFPLTCDLDVHAQQPENLQLLKITKGQSVHIVSFRSDQTILPQIYDANNSVQHFEGWYLIRAANGIEGWLRYDQLLSPCFEGLVMAG